jgi:AbrB family looped-hinge helix DNA binding protein
MQLAQSKVTAQGQISVPKEVRAKLGIVPGSVLTWEEANDGTITVRRAGKYTFEDMHRILFGGKKPKRRTLAQLKEGIGQYIDEQHARGRY